MQNRFSNHALGLADTVQAPSLLKGHMQQLLSPLNPNLALYFAEVADQTSISKAAEKLGVSSSTVSRKIDELEAALGVRLLDRDTRNVRLIEPGKVYLDYVHRALHILHEGQQNMERYGKDVCGRLRVICPPALAREHIADLVMRFLAIHPKLNIALDISVEPPKLENADFDVAISRGLPKEERAVVSKLGEVTRGYVGSRTFFERHGYPQTIQELARLPIVETAHENRLYEQFILHNAQGESVDLPIRLIANDMAVALKALLSGDYTGRMMHWYCQEHLRSGLLEKILPEQTETISLYSMVPTRKGNPLKVQLFVDFLKEHFTSRLQECQHQVGQVAYVGF